MIRVLAGSDKGRKLKRPKTDLVRPLTQRIKKSIFDIIGEKIYASKVLDLFAGSASFSIEALSRGADFVIMVENNHDAVLLIKENIKLVKAEGETNILDMDVEKAVHILNKKNMQFDIVFCDPPFIYKWDTIILETISKLISENGLLMIRHHSKCGIPVISNLTEKRVEKYGDSIVRWYSNPARSLLGGTDK